MGRKPGPLAGQGVKVRHQPSAELWRFCLAVLPHTRSAKEHRHVLTAMAGVSDTYSTRWQRGEMYVDRAENLVRLAGGLGVDIRILIEIVCGTITTERALQIHLGAAAPPESPAERLADAGLLGPVDAGGRLGDPNRHRQPLLLVISPLADHRRHLVSALQQNGTATGLLAENLSLGMVNAERHRPHITFIDLSSSQPWSFEACRVLSGLTCGPRRRCRVIAGTAVPDEMTTAAALMAGAAAVYPLPFLDSTFLAEMKHLPGLPGARRRGAGRRTGAAEAARLAPARPSPDAGWTTSGA